MPKNMNLILNTDWQFHYGPERDGVFSPILLPHTFQLPYYGEGEFYVGSGVYRRVLRLTAEDLDGVILLAFEGVFQHVQGWLNGVEIGEHSGGYTPFEFRLNRAARAGENELILRVDNQWRADLPPRAGEHTFCGGIYRDVSLCVLPRQHIRRNGIFIYTRALDGQGARIGLEIDLETDGQDPPGPVDVAIELEGRRVFTHRYPVQSGRIRTELRLNHPALWSPESPTLYSLTVSFGEDVQQVRFGVRTMRFDADQGFFLNGRHYVLEGINAHQDHGGWGDAVTRAGITRDLTLIKAGGFNFVRGSHYPKHRFFAQECDRLGLLFWSEVPFWGIGGYGEDGYWDAASVPADTQTFSRFEENCMQAVREMIAPIRNSPSVMVWSMGNEIFFCNEEQLDRARALAVRMVEYARQLDTTRAAGLGGTQRGDLHTIGDVTGFNGDGATLFRHPPIPNMVSEYGSVQACRPGVPGLRYTPGTRGETPPWRMGRALWCAFHHGSIAGIGDMGLIDLYRVPLRAYYDYREKQTGTPPPPHTRRGRAAALRLSADRRRIGTDGTDDCLLYAEYVDAKGRPVRHRAPITLTVVKGPACFPTGERWVMQQGNGTLADGSGAIELRAYSCGEILIQACSDGLPPAPLSLTAIGAAHADVAYPPAPSPTRRRGKGADLLYRRPVQVSSELPDCTRDRANDADPATFWQPAGEDRTACWTVDMESMRTLQSVTIVLSGARRRVRIELSPDGRQWKRLYSPLLPRRYDGTPLRLKKHVPARFLRIRIAGEGVKMYRCSAYEA